MFDVGALELVVIAVVALLVVGPERLPRLARTTGRWVGRARHALLSVKNEIDREIKAEELREILRRQNERKPLDEIIEEQLQPKTALPAKNKGVSAQDSDQPGAYPSPTSTQSGTASARETRT